MIEYFLKNKEWIFSGAGIFTLGLIIQYFNRKKHYTDNNSQQNHLKAEKINFSQTIVNNSSIGKTETKSSIKKVSNPMLKKIKEEYFSEKNIKRNYLITKLAKARNENSIVEIRTITDAAEEAYGWKHSDTVAELEKLEEEGLIWFQLKDNEMLSPYTRIRLTEKYFSIID
ncbi:hypothetical protein [Flavobacterium sp. WV_118_3]|jgi:hypothetical protein|uniref:hypothetical protein n=1 Tax=Flavobacterium sp. WV_118_3 TaxID=3151764 RepID=UPI00321A8293